MNENSFKHSLARLQHNFECMQDTGENGDPELFTLYQTWFESELKYLKECYLLMLNKA